jgi:heat shock protein HslJ
MKTLTPAPLAAALLLASAQPLAATDLISSPLAAATWQVVAIDGQPVEPPHSDDNRARPPAFTFGHRTYGGTAGCNSLGGYYAQIDARLYTMPGPQTAMGCSGARGAQEDAANAIFNASPTVTRQGETAVLEGGGHRMELRWLALAENADDPAAWQGSSLGGQSYIIHEVNGARTDGRRLAGRNPPRLRFGSGEITMDLDCPKPSRGVYLDNTEHLYAALITPPCETEARDAEMARIIGADPRKVSGPNGELLLASRMGWAILWNERRDRPK